MSGMENILMYGMITLTILVIALGIWILKLSKKIKKLTYGKDVKSLESTIIETNELVKKLKDSQVDQHTHIVKINGELGKTIQSVPIVRFDALKDMGGRQSFAIGLVDSHKNGVVISSMYTRNHVNVFAKEIVHGESKHTLTEEEKKVINL